MRAAFQQFHLLAITHDGFAVGGEVKAPLSGIPDEARARSRASVKLGAAAFNRAAGDASLGKFDLDARANMDGSSPDATVTLQGVSTAALGALVGQQDILLGALGDTANATLRVKPGSGQAAGGAGEVIAMFFLTVRSFHRQGDTETGRQGDPEAGSSDLW